MRILLLTQWFDPEPNNIKALVFAKELKKRGHEVQVLTGFPNYPTGKIYKGYKLKLFHKEEVNGIKINRVWLYPSHDDSAIKRILNYGSFALAATILGPFLIGKIDVIYVYHPPATIALPALILKIFKRAPILLDVNDLWPDTLWATGMMKNKFVIKMIDLWCKFSYNVAKKINVLGDGMKTLLVERGIPEEKISVIPCWSNETQIDRTTKNEDIYTKYNLKNSFVGIYAGAIGSAQNLETLIESAYILREKLPNFKLVFVGHGTRLQVLKDKVEELKLNNVVFIPIVPPRELAGILNLADILFIHLKNDPLFEITVPSKTQLYLATGKPIVAGLKGDAAKIIEDSNGGIVCHPENSLEISEAIMKIYKMTSIERDDMSKRGMEYYNSNLSLAAGVDKFEKEFIEMIK